MNIALGILFALLVLFVLLRVGRAMFPRMSKPGARGRTQIRLSLYFCANLDWGTFSRLCSAKMRPTQLAAYDSEIRESVKNLQR